MKKSPMTRMAVAALLRELLFKTQRYRDDKLAGKNPLRHEAGGHAAGDQRRDSPEVPRPPGRRHPHRRAIAGRIGVKATLDHCTDGELIADELAGEGLPVFVGPTLGSKSKAELRHKSFTTPGALYRAGLTVSIITDAPVILEKLPMRGPGRRRGPAYGRGLAAITINPARSLRASTAGWAAWSPARTRIASCGPPIPHHHRRPGVYDRHRRPGSCIRRSKIAQIPGNPDSSLRQAPGFPV